MAFQNFQLYPNAQQRNDPQMVTTKKKSCTKTKKKDYTEVGIIKNRKNQGHKYLHLDDIQQNTGCSSKRSKKMKKSKPTKDNISELVIVLSHVKMMAYMHPGDTDDKMTTSVCAANKFITRTVHLQNVAKDF